jgi:hypothetical protein
MEDKIRILFLSANPWTTSRILVDKEAREIFEKLEEGTHRDRFELIKHMAIRPGDLQRLLMKHEPHIVHFSGHGSKAKKLILEGAPGRGKQIDPQGLADVFGLYSAHLRLVVLNACFTKQQATALTNVIDYSVGISRAIGDRAGVIFAGAFYRALGFGKSVPTAFASAKAELKLTRTPRARGIELFVRNGLIQSGTLRRPDANDRRALGASLRTVSSGARPVRHRSRSATVSAETFTHTRKRVEGRTRILETSTRSYFRFQF